jgi:hypothetical protein
MNIIEPAHRRRPIATRPVIDGDFEVLLERRTWAEHDRVLIFVWSGEAPLVDVIREQRRPRLKGQWFRRHAKGRLIRAEVCYAGQVAVRSEIAMNGGVACFALVHSGGQLDPAALSVRHDQTPEDQGSSPIVRAFIVLEARPDTEVELLAEELLPKSDDEPQSHPRMAELLAVKRALSL